MKVKTSARGGDSAEPGAGADLFLEESPEALRGGDIEAGTGASTAMLQVQFPYSAAEFD